MYSARNLNPPEKCSTISGAHIERTEKPIFSSICNHNIPEEY